MPKMCAAIDGVAAYARGKGIMNSEEYVEALAKEDAECSASLERDGYERRGAAMWVRPAQAADVAPAQPDAQAEAPQRTIERNVLCEVCGEEVANIIEDGCWLCSECSTAPADDVPVDREGE